MSSHNIVLKYAVITTFPVPSKIYYNNTKKQEERGVLGVLGVLKAIQEDRGYYYKNISKPKLLLIYKISVRLRVYTYLHSTFTFTINGCMECPLNYVTAVRIVAKSKQASSLFLQSFFPRPTFIVVMFR